LVVRQTDGTFALKEISLAPYQSLVQKLCDEIDVEFTHVNRSTNRHADSLATLASKKKFEDDEAVIKISKRRTPAHGTLTISYMKMSLKKETCCDSRTKAISVVSAHGQERLEVLHSIMWQFLLQDVRWGLSSVPWR